MIKTEYRGYRIQYSENEDRWNCFGLEVSADNLSTLKAAIDKQLLATRKKSAVDVLVVQGFRGDYVEAKAIDARPYGRRTMNATPGWDHEIGVMMYHRGDKKPGKSFFAASELALTTPEVMEKIELAKSLDRKAEEAKILARTAWDAVPRITQEDVAGLIAAASEGEKK